MTRLENAPIETAMAIGPGLHRRDGCQPLLGRAGGTNGRVDLADLRAWLAAR